MDFATGPIHTPLHIYTRFANNPFWVIGPIRFASPLYFVLHLYTKGPSKHPEIKVFHFSSPPQLIPPATNYLPTIFEAALKTTISGEQLSIKTDKILHSCNAYASHILSNNVDQRAA